MEIVDDDLTKFEAEGAGSPAETSDQGYIENEGARIWYSTHGSGEPIILLHGGLGHSGNWGYQVQALIKSGHRAILIDSRGHGRSTRDTRHYTYELLASDVLAVMNALHIEKPLLVGWSDGACTALILGAQSPSRVAGIFYFACNMNPDGVKPFEMTPTINRCFNRHQKDYASLSPTPEGFQTLVTDLSLMQKTQPNYSAADLAKISVPITIVQSGHDEFIKQEHAEHLARSIPGAELIILPGVSHFAPLQRPAQFNAAILAFATKVQRPH